MKEKSSCKEQGIRTDYGTSSKVPRNPTNPSLMPLMPQLIHRRSLSASNFTIALFSPRCSIPFAKQLTQAISPLSPDLHQHKSESSRQDRKPLSKAILGPNDQIYDQQENSTKRHITCSTPRHQLVQRRHSLNTNPTKFPKIIQYCHRTCPL